MTNGHGPHRLGKARLSVLGRGEPRAQAGPETPVFTYLQIFLRLTRPTSLAYSFIYLFIYFTCSKRVAEMDGEAPGAEKDHLQELLWKAQLPDQIPVVFLRWVLLLRGPEWSIVAACWETSTTFGAMSFFPAGSCEISPDLEGPPKLRRLPVSCQEEPLFTPFPIDMLKHGSLQRPSSLF